MAGKRRFEVIAGEIESIGDCDCGERVRNGERERERLGGEREILRGDFVKRPAGLRGKRSPFSSVLSISTVILRSHMYLRLCPSQVSSRLSATLFATHLSKDFILTF